MLFMKKTLFSVLLLFYTLALAAQKPLTPEQLWRLGRLSGLGISKDSKFAIYAVSTPDVAENKSDRKFFRVPVSGGTSEEISSPAQFLPDRNTSPDGRYKLSHKPVSIQKVTGQDRYPDLPKSNGYVYTSLDYRHWDTWRDGTFDHVFLTKSDPVAGDEPIDLLAGEPFDCPQKPFGGEEDYIWSPDSKKVVYVTKKKSGTQYTLSTNTDLFEYDIATASTRNLTENNPGYDVSPAFSSTGTLAWLQMKRDGYEADKQDLVLLSNGITVNLTGHRDDIHVNSFQWAADGKSLFFTAPTKGTIQLFEVKNTGNTRMIPPIRQITNGDFDVNGIVGQSGQNLVVTRADMNHPADLFSIDIATGRMNQLTEVNKEILSDISSVRTESIWITTTDKKKMLTWVIYPPDFDPTKKYPTLLYCQGGPQSALTQFYSFRWNFQLMASQGYIVVAPNRRGMPGHGTEWNEQVSKDWGGQVIDDYLSAIDHVSKQPYVDKTKLGCVGASFGGFSVFALAAVHNKRFKTFISHDGVFDFRSMYGTTDEMFFENWEKGGPYWDRNNKVAQRSFAQSPSNFVDKWDTPIYIIQGGKDYRVPIEQGLQAFQAAQLQGIKSKLLYLPEENHWVLSGQNALLWHREFFSWLEETLK
jgi:dipeptidyl aminopeptidase/acylaminoacyl peptidase